MITSHWFVTRPMPLYWRGWVTPLQQWWWKLWYQKMLFEGSCSLSDDSLSTSKGIFADLIHLIIPPLVASSSFWCKFVAFSNTLCLLKGDIVYYEVVCIANTAQHNTNTKQIDACICKFNFSFKCKGGGVAPWGDNTIGNWRRGVWDGMGMYEPSCVGGAVSFKQQT